MKTWVTEQYIDVFLNNIDYDIRKTGNGRWIDQKCTPDVLSFIADCILKFIEANGEKKGFTTNDIWFLDYSIENAVNAFNKPRPDSKAARNEYDKFFGQPLKLLGYSGILKETKKNNQNYYVVYDLNLLEYISLREINALTFIQKYNEKVLNDSGLYGYFNSFFKYQNKDTFERMKNQFASFTKKYTKINGDLECGRIFTKVVNPLALKYKSYGTEKGRLSKEPISLDVLMYNRDNFRDIYLGKPKNITRQEYCITNGIKYSEGYGKYSSEKAKRFIRIFNDSFRSGVTEVKPECNPGPAINMHHIFPESAFPELSGFLENLIALTPNQHFIEAHPMGNTHIVDKNYQIVCLLTKAKTIYNNIKKSNNKIYHFENFLYVLKVGFDDDEFMNYSLNTFNELLTTINCRA